MRETVGDAIDRGQRYLDRRGITDVDRSAEWLMAHVLGTDLGALRLRLRDVLAVDASRAFSRLLCRRGRRIPTQYLLRTWEFFGHELYVDPGALIPRPDTETLVEQTLGRLAKSASVAIDVGTGSGCIAVALALARPAMLVLATDISRDALDVAQRNVALHRLDGRIRLLHGDLLAPLAGQVERATVAAIVSNPPYIPTHDIDNLEPEVKDHEPRQALDGGHDGLSVFRRLIGEAPPWLRNDGLLIVEVGHDQADQVSELMTRSGDFARIEVATDPGGVRRVVCATRKTRA